MSDDFEIAKNGHVMVAAGAGTSNPNHHQAACPGCAAIDRIEARLREAGGLDVRRCKEIGDLRKRVAELEQEKERLRAALERIDLYPEHTTKDSEVEAAKEMRQIAREALGVHAE
jgi:Zn ribbon nucleic-acid-binding protein